MKSLSPSYRAVTIDLWGSTRLFAYFHSQKKHIFDEIANK